ncbi:hypothetical protein AUJ27_00030 [Candidatus Falkowbacteria bacterium CG1_02_37_44]|uniref:Methyltransferase type 11 domain-containing protein n=1 Tax=Candidatus Falkowbacteria bacterium CG1_02_37_44 TaxID=1805146 RepID=A0A1J4TE58_9BACT|nr:MAG: hypothetical protein AUJ27_00030 [Candidatus Falkowbacteria bacterium CG1_02_37_44]
MNTNSAQNMHLIRNARRLGSIGLYGRERAEIFSKWLGKGKKILELGCRDGSLTKLFAEGNKITGVDIDKNALELFEKNLGGKAVYLDLNSEWPFGENEFDAVVASEVLEHLYKPEETVKKVLLSLKPGGLFIGTVPNAFSLANRFRLFMAQPNKTALADPTHVHQFSYKELKSIMEKYFKEAEIFGIGRLAPTLGKIMPGMFSFLLVFRCKK